VRTAGIGRVEEWRPVVHSLDRRIWDIHPSDVGSGGHAGSHGLDSGYLELGEDTEMYVMVPVEVEFDVRSCPGSYSRSCPWLIV
jgi:hypothetical protein